MPARWSLYRPGALHYRCWDKAAVVFNTLNSDTHIVSLLGFELLNTLEKYPASTMASLLDELADVFADMAQEESEQLLETALLQLLDIALVTCDAP